jgi:hypothetical protein
MINHPCMTAMTGKFLEYITKFITVNEVVRDTNFSIAN